MGEYQVYKLDVKLSFIQEVFTNLPFCRIKNYKTKCFTNFQGKTGRIKKYNCHGQDQSWWLSMMSMMSCWTKIHTIFLNTLRRSSISSFSQISQILLDKLPSFCLHLVATVGGWDNIFLFGIFSPVEIKEPDQVFIPESFNGDWRS